MGKYKLIKEDTMKNLIEFLDEVQFDAATDGGTESMHKVNFCNWAINELLNSPEARIKDLTDSKPKKPKRNLEMIMLTKHLWIGIYLICLMKITRNL